MDALQERVAALNALAQRRPRPDRLGEVRDALNDKFEGVQGAAVKVLGAWGDADSRKLLRSFLTKAFERPHGWAIRGVAIKALTPHIDKGDVGWVLDLYLGQAMFADRAVKTIALVLASMLLGVSACSHVLGRECEVRSLAAVFDSPTDYFGSQVCSEAVAVREGDMILLFPADRPVPADRYDLALVLDNTRQRALLDELSHVDEKAVYLRGEVDGMTGCFASEEASSEYICGAIRRPIFFRGQVTMR